MQSVSNLSDLFGMVVAVTDYITSTSEGQRYASDSTTTVLQYFLPRVLAINACHVLRRCETIGNPMFLNTEHIVDQDDITPLGHLNQYSVRWKVLARCTDKRPMTKYRNPRGEGTTICCRKEVM